MLSLCSAIANCSVTVCACYFLHGNMAVIRGFTVVVGNLLLPT